MIMNSIDKYIYLYSYLHNRRGINKYLLTPLRRIVRTIARVIIPQYFQKVPIAKSKIKSDVVISLTSFPARIDDVHLVIQCLLRQTISPLKIILWLSKQQFEGVEIPDSLRKLEDDTFNIRFVEGDVKSHKKYFYVLTEYPNNRILIVDDDLYYPSDMLEIMLKAANNYPDSIICRFGSIMKFNNENILPYNDWWNEISEESNNPNFFFGSGGGILLNRNMLYEDVLNLDLAIELTPLADDIWLNAMINLAKTNKYKVKFGLFLTTKQNVANKLSDENVGNDKNTIQMKKIIEYYKNNKGMNPFEERVV